MLNDDILHVPAFAPRISDQPDVAARARYTATVRYRGAVPPVTLGRSSLIARQRPNNPQ